jgi:hypothetical protein
MSRKSGYRFSEKDMRKRSRRREDPAKNFVVIMKDGKIFKNALN